jgi:hypothetical protein
MRGAAMPSWTSYKLLDAPMPVRFNNFPIPFFLVLVSFLSLFFLPIKKNIVLVVLFFFSSFPCCYSLSCSHFFNQAQMRHPVTHITTRSLTLSYQRYCTTLEDMATKPAGCYYKPGNSPSYQLWFNPTHTNTSIIDPNRLSLCGVSSTATTCPGTTCHMVECGNGHNSSACAGEAEMANTCVADDTINEIRCCADGATPPNSLWTQRPGCTVWAESDMSDGGCSNGTYVVTALVSFTPA